MTCCIRMGIISMGIIIGFSATAEVPVNHGLSQQYPGDIGIIADPSVLFADGFESGDISLWDEDQTHGDKQRLTVVSAPFPVFAGSHALQMTATRNRDSGGGLIKWLDSGQDQIFARFYVRFAPDAGYVHHFVHINGETSKWGSFGKAGLKPDGSNFFTSGIEPWFDWGKNPPPGRWNFYSYWPDMKPSRDGKFWGNSFQPQSGPIPRDQWICIEIHIKLNSPGRPDGEQTLWENGIQTGHFTGINWRNNIHLKANVFWLMSYITEKSYVYSAQHAPDHQMEFNPDTHTVWFDQIVVATRYIGPMNTTNKNP